MNASGIHHNEQEIDLSIFKRKSAVCSNSDHRKCKGIERLIVALRYYSLLNIKENENHREIFRSFINEIYAQTQILNDNNHLMICHNNQLRQISERIMEKQPCTIKECKATSRHFKKESIININDDQIINLFVSIFDSLHFWIYHCFQSGFRIESNTHTNNEEENKNMDEDDTKSHFDKEFDRLHSAIRARSARTKSFERIRNGNNSKFTISINSDHDNTTFIDELFQHLISDSIHSNCIQKLKEFIETQLYDSDSIKMDISNDDNIANNIQNSKCTKSIQQFIKSVAVMASTFSLGFRFYYWDYYKEKDDLPIYEQMVYGLDNKHDHSGYKVRDLYIEAKYTSFKEEIGHFPHFTLEQYKEARIKADKYMKTKQVKRINAKFKGIYHMLHYDIQCGASLLFVHLLALILYTDYSKLSTAFSATFRKNKTFETLKSIKQRNACYFWMSKHLRELVEIYGKCSLVGEFRGLLSEVPLNGYFYCGMNRNLKIPSFAMRLNCPSSTSKQIEVAIKFSGPKGVVFTFDNPSDHHQYNRLRAWDCSWISRFKEEDEVLFFGGYYRIKVVNVRLIETKENFQCFVAAILYFDLLLTGGDLYKIKREKSDYLIIKALMDYVLKKKTKEAVKMAKLPLFIIDCFSAFCQNKKQIILNLGSLNKYAGNVIDLIFHSLKERVFNEEKRRKVADFSNMIRSEIFSVFPNVKTLIVQTTYSHVSYSFSLRTLLLQISTTNLNKIVIKSQEVEGHSWIKKVWKSDGKIWKKEYAAKNFEIEMQKEQTHKSLFYNLKITKVNK